MNGKIVEFKFNKLKISLSTKKDSYLVEGLLINKDSGCLKRCDTNFDESRNSTIGSIRELTYFGIKLL